MIEVSALIAALSFMTLAIWTILFGHNLIKLLKECIAVFRINASRVVSGTHVPYVDQMGFANNVEKSAKSQKISDLPPDVLAPALKNPPRPAGGMGRRVDQ